jgi:phage/plasmid-associated DNA primase
MVPTIPEHYNRSVLNFNYGINPAALAEGFLFLHQVMDMVFPDAAAKQMFQIAAGISLSGRGDCKKVFVCADLVDGNNGKSMLMQLMQLMLGDYAKRLPAAVLTGSRSNGEGASAFTMSLKSKRWAGTEEVGNGQQVNSSRVKEMTPGLEGSALSSRGLYGGPEDLKITWKLFFSANRSQFKFDNSDDAFKKRLVVLMFAVTFTSNTELVNGTTFQAEDKELLNKLLKTPGFMPAFFRCEPPHAFLVIPHTFFVYL